MERALSNLAAWSLQALLVIVMSGALPLLFRLHAPAVRHAYWRALLLICLILPLVQPWRIDSVSVPILNATERVSSPHSASSASLSPASKAALSSQAERERWIRIIGFVLVTGAVVRLAWLVAGIARLRRLRRAGEPPAPDEATDDLFTLLAARADVRYADDLRQPVTFGVYKPVVLLPKSLSARPSALRRAVFAHELWHVRRRDWLWLVIEQAVRAVLWFHPAILWLISRVQSSREEVVDELTVLATNARRSYLEALLVFADEPRIYPATPFARRRHLFQRMLLISREAVMSSRRIVSSCAAMGAVVIAAGWYGVAAFPLKAAAPASAQGQPRDLRPSEPRPASSREQQLRSTLETSSAPLASYFEVAKLQEARGAFKEAESTLAMARTAFPNEPTVLMTLAGLYQRSGQFAEAVGAVEQVATMQASDPVAQHIVATFYEQKVRVDGGLLSPADRDRYIQLGIAAEDRALGLKPDYVDAMIVKNILLRHQANAETNATTRTQLIAEADQLRSRAIELQQSQRQLMGSGGPGVSVGVRNGAVPPPPPPPPQPRGATPPPPPPPPPPGGAELVDGMATVRVGGNIKQPTKLRNVPPVYPPLAQQAGVQGVVILEITIDTTGLVRDGRIMRSIPLLDEAALDAVRQWQFTPTVVNGQAVPVIMTVTVNFNLGG
jgi:TonB family protein